MTLAFHKSAILFRLITCWWRECDLCLLLLARCFWSFANGPLLHCRNVGCIPLWILIFENFLYSFCCGFAIFLRRLQFALHFLNARHLRFRRIDVRGAVRTQLFVVAETISSPLQLELTLCVCLFWLNRTCNDRSLSPQSIHTVQSLHISVFPHWFLQEVLFLLCNLLRYCWCVVNREKWL